MKLKLLVLIGIAALFNMQLALASNNSTMGVSTGMLKAISANDGSNTSPTLVDAPAQIIKMHGIFNCTEELMKTQCPPNMIKKLLISDHLCASLVLCYAKTY